MLRTRMPLRSGLLFSRATRHRASITNSDFAPFQQPRNEVSQPMHIAKVKLSAGVAWCLHAVLFCLLVAGCARQSVNAGTTADTAKQPSNSDDQTALVHQGKMIFDETPKYASKYVGNRLACNDCHIGSSNAAYAPPMM